MQLAWLTLVSALLTGLVGSGHCAVMCGGIATGFPAMAPRAQWRYVVEPNLGRVLGYAVAGAVAGGLGHAIVGVAAMPWLRIALRAATGFVLLAVGLRLWRGTSATSTYSSLGGGIWRALKPIQRHLLPASTTPRRLALGALWGWLPCGLSTTLLAAAWLQASAVNGAVTMAAFGLGTLPVMLPLTWSGQQLGRRLLRGRLRAVAGLVIATAGALTITAPWLVASMPGLHGPLSALGCLSPA
ncbi:sulfite exporter TauE/SafE family protein [Lysobacter sp. TY2-98]|uniref:sulfite exporter TauE/SafE family protein n=1 Tax=Lysobacter sp. TY2-98 TaxID=2290922 RepID=UPI000E20BAA3|nr:sulfite exporter TauE/SafE family protein [Lysobacter sp. TY2-98]AXK71642.1 sulfite exporter TauE/SafE family protein [Lysobacter sp. TY2-98]